MTIIGSDDREIITVFPFPYSTVTTVDIYNSTNNESFIGTGITIAPNHVLTAAHNAFDIDDLLGPLTGNWRTTISSQEDQLELRVVRILDNIDENVEQEKINFLSDYDTGELIEDDIALFKTSNAPLNADDVIGLMTFVDPQDACYWQIYRDGRISWRQCY